MSSTIFIRVALFVFVCAPVRALADVPTVAPVVHSVYPHDPQAFTQGLLYWDGRLFESTGLRGKSTLRRVNPTSGIVEQRIHLDPREFGEGLARVGDDLVQLTWMAGKAHVYSINDFARLRTHEYSGQGWGLCFDGRRLIMSDGSQTLYFRDPRTFALQGKVSVSRSGRPVSRLNELECVAGFVYANVWQTNDIVKIDAASGRVVATLAAGGLLTPTEARTADVLNGIAYVPATGRFLLTGKLWPKLFEVSFPAAAAPQHRVTGDQGKTDQAPAVASNTPVAASTAAPHPPPAPRVLSSCRCALRASSPSDSGELGLGLWALWWLRRVCRTRE